MLRLIIAGSNSYIGKRLENRLDIDKIPFIGLSPDSDNTYFKFDLLNTMSFDFNLIKENDIIIFLAAISSPDMCQSNFKVSFQINVLGTIRFIEESIMRGAKIIFFSSDTVYGNSSEKNDEDIRPFNPIGEYAMMKLSVENYFRNESSVKIFRLSYVFSWHDKFMTYLHNCRNKDIIAEILHPFVRKMIYLDDIIEGVVNLAGNWEKFDCQIFNFSGNMHYSRLDIVKLYHENVHPIKYILITPEDSFFMARPKIIYVNSKNSERLISKSFTPIIEAIKIEKSKYYFQ